MATGDPAAIAETLSEQAHRIGADCLNLRVHNSALSAADARQQIDALAAVRALLAAEWQGSGPR
jgi:3-deoxy-D-arabino-heptulosonate 7-phosphate (DAHP) synthase